ncbi:MAG: phosphoribosylformylglycinamidine synthase I [Candidatus Eremiobacteraeota bacterium]|nr:phosphoribosylformylglycinamidine synthase I [Candidatus Eremiobacteraeota bacterium]
MSARVAVLVYPGTNSEDETLRVLQAVGVNAHLVHWNRADSLASFDAFVLPGGFAYEDRIRAGAVAAHDRMTDAVIEGAQKGKLVLGICNGAQVLLEAGLVPGTGPVRRPTAAFTRNAPLGKFICRHVYIKLALDPQRSAMTAALARDAVIPAWAAHGEGRLAASDEQLSTIAGGGHVSFVYARADGGVDASATPNGSALGAAGLVNKEGNVLALMPHPERDAWNFNHPDRAAGGQPLAASGGIVFFRSFAKALA